MKKTKSVQKVRAFTKRLRGESTTTMAKCINNKNTMKRTSTTKNLKPTGGTFPEAPPPPPHCTPRTDSFSLPGLTDNDVTSRSSSHLLRENIEEVVEDR